MVQFLILCAKFGTIGWKEKMATAPVIVEMELPLIWLTNWWNSIFYRAHISVNVYNHVLPFLLVGWLYNLFVYSSCYVWLYQLDINYDPKKTDLTGFFKSCRTTSRPTVRTFDILSGRKLRYLNFCIFSLIRRTKIL